MDQDHDPFDLDRFVRAQDGDYEAALRELRTGCKTGHWIWYILPQLRGLGRSEFARVFGIASIDEARAYLRHPLLGPRIRECAAVIAVSRTATAYEYFHSPDDMKVRSSMTLFMRADPHEPAFRAVIDRYYGGQADPRTDELIGLDA